MPTVPGKSLLWQLDSPFLCCFAEPSETIAEAALEAWETVVPGRLSADPCHVSELLCLISARVRRLEGESDRCPIAGRASVCGGAGLRMRGGAVHFLDFWQAFHNATVSAGTPSSGLMAEIEELRDAVVLRLESCGLPAWALVEEVHRMAPTSVLPRFWQVAAASFNHAAAATITIPVLTDILIEWIRDAASHPSLASVVESPRRAGLAVRLHIYDCGHVDSIQTLNSVFAHEMSPTKFGGIFHAGVEVRGLEWSFDYQPDPCKPGVSCALPRTAPQHHYRETLELGFTLLSEDAIANVVSQLIEEYPGHDYDLIHRNCCTFCDDFIARLGLGNIPGWVNRTSRLAAGLNLLYRSAQVAVPSISDRFQALATGTVPPRRWRPPTPPPARRSKHVPEGMAAMLEI